MANHKTLGEILTEHGVSRRGFLKFCAATASMMALPPTMTSAIAEALATGEDDLQSSGCRSRSAPAALNPSPAVSRRH